MAKIVDIPRSVNDETPESLVFHFDLAFAQWTSQLVELAGNGLIDTPWVSWHKDRKSLMAVVYRDQASMHVAVRLRRDGARWLIADVSVSRGWSIDIGGFADLAGLDDALEECRALGARFIHMVETMGRLLDPWRSSARGAVVRRSEVAYAALAARYVDLVQGGERHPGKVLGEELGLSPVTVAQRIREARLAPIEVLTPATRGTAGGYLTDKAKRMLISAASAN